MALGEPDAGKPPVRFDEGRSETVIGLCLSIRPLRLLYSISKSVAVVLGSLRLEVILWPPSHSPVVFLPFSAQFFGPSMRKV